MSAEVECVIVNQVIKTLQTGFCGSAEIVVMEVFVGGSVDQVTALPDKADVDLVLYSRSISQEEIMDTRKRNEVLSKIKEFLKKEVSEHFEAQRETPHALQFQTSRAGTFVEVLLLPSFRWKTPEQLAEYVFFKNPEIERLCLSSGESKWQTEFIESQPTRAKEFIRRIKHWRNVYWKDKEDYPSSYLLSLLVVAAYRVVPENLKLLTRKKLSEHKRKKIADMVTIEMKRLTHSHKTLDIYWEDRLHGHKGHMATIPRIIDPANPANNLYDTGIGKQCKEDGPEKYWKFLASRIDTLDLSIPTP